jgi:hypothetical protein
MKKALIVLALITLVPVVGWKLMYPTFTYRYRLTIEAEVDGQVRQGSSVIEVSFQKNPAIAQIPWSPRMVGQAAAVDLGSKGVLVWLPGGGKNVSAPFLFLRAYPRYQSRPASFPPDRAGLREVAATPLHTFLQAGNLPGFAWLPDRNDRTSAKPVYPKQLPWDVAPEIRILSVQIEKTDAPLTRNLAQLLPWLPARYEYERKTIEMTQYGVFHFNAHSVTSGVEP